MYKYKMGKKYKVVSLNVEKDEDTHFSVIAGETNGCLVKRVLKKVDKCIKVWTNQEINNVSDIK